MSKKKKKSSKKIRTGPSSEVFDKVKMLQIEKKHLVQNQTPQFDLSTPKGFFKGFMQKITQANLSGLGAQLAYFFLLALFPLLIFLMTLVPFLNLPQTQVFTMMENVLPEQVYGLIESTLKDVLENRNGGLLSIGILGTLWSASNGVNALINSLNLSYGKSETRPFFNCSIDVCRIYTCVDCSCFNCARATCFRYTNWCVLSGNNRTR